MPLSRAYYNEIDPFAAAWLRELIDNDLIAPGDVDERPIQQLTPQDLHGYTQCHFFAGIGVWSYALRQVGWPDDRAVWTGSCPCQPFSVSGKKQGFKDERHLWPEWIPLIRVCEPPVVFGEQVASKDGLAWLDAVQADLEGTGYAFGAADLCAAGVGAPHIRQRLYFVAESQVQQQHGRREAWRERRESPAGSFSSRSVERMGNNNNTRLERRYEGSVSERADQFVTRSAGSSGELAHTHGTRQYVSSLHVRQSQRRNTAPSSVERGTGCWSSADWIPCTDGKIRPVESGTFPLVTGAPARVGRLRGYGNALNAETAKVFIEAYLEA